MDEKMLYLITDVPGFTPQVGRLVSMMNYVRWTTLRAVDGLTMDELDYLHDENSNSIGALLSHIASVEVSYQVGTFENRGLNRDEMAEWGAALKLGDRGRSEIKGHGLEYYVKLLNDVRGKTIRGFAERDDEWLSEESIIRNDMPANNYFKWFHVSEDELNHRGQIRWIRKRLPKSG
jgi:uncharacterized damage-inducible protein DinB